VLLSLSLSPLKCLFQNRNKAAIFMVAAVKCVLQYNHVFIGLVGTIDPTLRLRSAPGYDPRRIFVFLPNLDPHFFEPCVRSRVYLLVKILSRAAKPKAEGKLLGLASDLAKSKGAHGDGKRSTL
jgi:hypothetical protein